MEGNLLLVLKDIKEIIERLDRIFLTMYDYPTDPVTRFLEHGLSMTPRDTKRAAWLATLYKGTVHSFTILEEFAEPITSGERLLYYKKYIEIKNIEYYIDKLSLVNHNLINSQIIVDTPEINNIPHRFVHYYQNTAIYVLDIEIAHTYSKVSPMTFIEYFIEYAIHMLIVNKVNIKIEQYIMRLDYIELLIDIIQSIWKQRAYNIRNLIRNYY